MLLQIHKFLQKEKIASNQQIARAFHISMSALEPMMRSGVRQGIFYIVQDSASCKKACGQCVTNEIVYYQL